MKIRQLIASNPAWLDHLVNEYKIDVVRDGDLVSLKYNQIESPMHDPIVQECRGMVVDTSTNTILAHPYNKFWSHGESLAADIDWATARVLEKLDGSLITLHWNGGWKVASSGHPTAGGPYNNEESRTFRDAFWETWHALGMGLPDGWLPYCFMFEFCANAHRIVCLHEKPRIVLHGGRDLVTGAELGLQDLTEIAAARRWEMVKSFPIGSMGDALLAAEVLDPIQTEGFVVVDAKFNRVKIKSPRYVILHHMKGEATTLRAIALWQTGEAPELLAHFPEMAPKIIPIHDALDGFAQCVVDDLIANAGAATRKEFAAVIKDKPWAATCFRMYGDAAPTVEKAKEIMRAQTLASLERLIDS